MARALLLLGVLASATLLIDAFKGDNGFSPEPRDNDFIVDYGFTPEPREDVFKADNGFSPEPRENDFIVDYGFTPENRKKNLKDLGRVVPCSRSKKDKIELNPGESVTFQSPNYPSKYGSNSKCRWNFWNTDDSGITITCSDFQLQERKNGKCNDKLKLGNDVFCGTSLTSYSGGRSLKAVFRSNRRRNAQGFSCTAVADYATCNTDSPTTTNEPDVGTCKCGQVNRVSRIVGGIETEVNEYPWMVAMVWRGTRNVKCGASVIGSKHLLTAAHCLTGLTYQDIQFLVGAHSLTNPASSELRLDAASFTLHPGWGNSADHVIDNDIAIIELGKSISFTSSEIRPVCLPISDDNDYSNVMATVSGWGLLEHNTSVNSDVLMGVDVPTMTNTKCRGYADGYENYERITENMLCAGYEEGGKDSCSNDSGGPLSYNPGDGYTQIGVVSWGRECARPRWPGVYARVTKYLSWIKSQTASSTTCPAS